MNLVECPKCHAVPPTDLPSWRRWRWLKRHMEQHHKEPPSRHRKPPTKEIYFKVDTEAWYDSEGGQSINFTIPAGTKLKVAAALIYGEP